MIGFCSFACMYHLSEIPIDKSQMLILFYVGTSILAVLLAGYFAQKYLPPPKPKIVGIDLG